MLKKTIKYTDYNGVEREEDFYFNLSKAELTQMQMEVEGGLEAKIQKIIQAKDTQSLMAMFKELILKSYGKKSDDGRMFEKSKEISREFECSAAFDELYMELATNDKAAAEFVNGIIPASLQAAVKKEVEAKN